MRMFRQGDVLLVQVKAVPAGAQMEREPGRIVLAHGEATGHAHTVDERAATAYALAGKRFLKVARAVALEHQEHAAIEIPAGTYEIVRQREYTPEAIRNVAD